MKIKYPRTPHLPWSPGYTGDDVRLMDLSHFEDKQVVITEKMDGENTTLYRDGFHARSLDSNHHPSRDWVKRLQGEKGWEIPEGWRVCGENLYAKHSISYENLESYFYVFSIWDENNICQSWQETLDCCCLLGLTPVPVLWQGVWDAAAVEALGTTLNLTTQEGYVVRVVDSFSYEQFNTCVAKMVRAGHVEVGAEHWTQKIVEPNKLKK